MRQLIPAVACMAAVVLGGCSSSPSGPDDNNHQPSGTIAFGSDRDGDSDIYIMRSDGTSQTQITNDPGRDWWPSWGE